MKIKDLPKYKKVEMYWGDCHDIINTKTRKMFATLYTLGDLDNDHEGAKEYFDEYCNLDIDKIEIPKGKFISRKAKDGIWDVIVNAELQSEVLRNNSCEAWVKKFDKRVFERVIVSL